MMPVAGDVRWVRIHTLWVAVRSLDQLRRPVGRCAWRRAGSNPAASCASQRNLAYFKACLSVVKDAAARLLGFVAAALLSSAA